MRQLGAAILLASLLVAGGLYWSETRSTDIPEEQLFARYARDRDREMGMLYGQGGRDFMNVLEAVDSPAGHAILVIGAGALGALICFYRARLDNRQS
jgi:hypothetical protein